MKFPIRLSRRDELEARYVPEPNSGCWLWIGHTQHGYGVIRRSKGADLAHRLAYELFVGPIPDELCIDHLCRVRSCINPAHLRVVTLAENTMADGSLSPSKINAGRTECVAGHPFDEANTRYVNGDPSRRRCRKCQVRRNVASKRRLALVASVLLIAAFVSGQTPVPTPRPQCTQQGFYQRTCDLSWVFANPGMAGHIIPNGCAAHTQMIYGSNGAQYALIDQCPQGCVGTQGLYKKPDDSVALPQWQFFYTDPDALQHRTQFGYIGPGVPPPGFQTYQFVTLANVPDPPRATLMNAYGCSVGTPTPVPSPTRTPTPAPSIYAAYITWAANNGITSGCGGGNFCPDNPVTRAQMTTFLWNFYHAFVDPTKPLPPCQQQFLDVRCAP